MRYLSVLHLGEVIMVQCVDDILLVSQNSSYLTWLKGGGGNQWEVSSRALNLRGLARDGIKWGEV